MINHQSLFISHYSRDIFLQALTGRWQICSEGFRNLY